MKHRLFLLVIVCISSINIFLSFHFLSNTSNVRGVKVSNHYPKINFKVEYGGYIMNIKDTVAITFKNDTVFNEAAYLKNSSEIPFYVHEFDADASHKYSASRYLPDQRDVSCRDINVEQLPPISVIISFFNEERSVLLRTIISILTNTPENLLKEILLVDDFSSDHSIGPPLKFLWKVKLTRNAKRLGLVSSRLVGMKIASSDFVMFMDSHCEVTKGWLQPLLEYLIANPKSIVAPVIDTIDSRTFLYKKNSILQRGGFGFSLEFKWEPMFESDSINPYTSPAMSGGLFAVSKSFFESIGRYDSKLKFWGGENIELSIKAWLCGGKIAIVPCSRIGHVFRDHLPYVLPGGSSSVVLRNNHRIAEKLLGPYKILFYDANPRAIDLDPITISDQLQLKKSCKGFDWYIKEVYPELRSSILEFLYHPAYEIYHNDLCIRGSVNILSYVNVYPCSTSPYHIWYLLGNTLRQHNLCLIVNEITPMSRLTLSDCRRDTVKKLFKVSGNRIQLIDYNLCLQLNGNTVVLNFCSSTASSQSWNITRKTFLFKI